MGDNDGLLDTALDAIAAADIDVLVDADVVEWDAKGTRDLVRIFRHLDRGPDIEDLTPRIPFGGDAEGFDRHRRAAAPDHAERQMPRAFGKMLVDLAPDEGLVEQHIAAMFGMDRR